MPKKTAAQLQREINEALAAQPKLSRHQIYLLSRRGRGGELRAGYLTPAGWHGDPMVIEDRKLRLEALREQPAPRFPKDPGRSHAMKKKQKKTTTLWPSAQEPITEVMFRVFPEGDVIALFPQDKQGAGLINSYQHLGQHGEASQQLIKELRRASPAEYAPLLAELKRIGYRLRIGKRQV